MGDVDVGVGGVGAVVEGAAPWEACFCCWPGGGGGGGEKEERSMRFCKS